MSKQKTKYYLVDPSRMMGAYNDSADGSHGQWEWLPNGEYNQGWELDFRSWGSRAEALDYASIVLRPRGYKYMVLTHSEFMADINRALDRLEA